METVLLYVFLHFERFVEGPNSFWWPYLSSLPSSFPELPVFLPASDQRLLSSMPQGGFVMAAYFDSVNLVGHVVASVLAAQYPRLYRVETPLDVTRVEQELLWAISAVHVYALDSPRNTASDSKAASAYV